MYLSDLGLALLSIIKLRKRGRAAEGTGLLNRHICKSIEGSNPSVSAKCRCSSVEECPFIKGEVGSSILLNGTR